MKISLIVVGKTDASYIKDAVEEYLKRLKHYLSFDVIQIPDIKNSKNMSVNEQKQKEGDAILKNVQLSDHVVLLDEKGREFSSMEFADAIERKMSSGVKRVLFVIGGPYGFSDSVYSRANEKISLSRMTFSHQMVRLIFVEQLYRAMTILNNEPYHHE